MSDARWRRVQDLYHAALERPAPVRAEFLNEECAGDAGLLHEVQSLLDQAISADQFSSLARFDALEPSAIAGTAGARHPFFEAPCDSEVARYQLRSRLLTIPHRGCPNSDTPCRR